MRFVRSRGLNQVRSVLCALCNAREGVIVMVGSGGKRICGHCAIDRPSHMLMAPRGRR